MLNLHRSARTVSKTFCLYFCTKPSIRSSDDDLFSSSKFWSKISSESETELKRWLMCSACVDVLLSWHVHDWIWMNKRIYECGWQQWRNPFNCYFFIIRGGCLLSFLVGHIYVLQATATLRIWGKTSIWFPSLRCQQGKPWIYGLCHSQW